MELTASAENVSNADYDLVSYTAIKILQKRAWHTSIAYTRQMADALGVEWRISKPRAWARNALWGEFGAGLFLQFRHEAISQALDNFPGSAVLEIAAGYSTRGLVESSSREAYIESDLPQLIRCKPRLIETIRGSGPATNHYFCGLNACSAADMHRVGELVDRLKLKKPLVVVHEGLMMYLSDAEQRSVRDNIRTFLSEHSPHGAWITTDFSERDVDETLWQRMMNWALTRRVNRRFNRFKDDRAVGAFLSAADLSYEELPNIKADEGETEARAVAELFRAWTITLRSRAEPLTPRHASISRLGS